MRMLGHKHKRLLVLLGIVAMVTIVKHYWHLPEQATDEEQVHSRLLPRSQMDQKSAFIYKQHLGPNRMSDGYPSITWNEDRVYMSEEMAIFLSNDEFNIVRIPAMIYNEGKFLIFCEARDRQADLGFMRIVSKRGTLLPNNSVVWEKTKFVHYHKGMRFMNPCPVYDKIRKTVILVFLGVDSTLSEKHMLRVGRHQIKLFVMRSSDFGQTWSKPKDITDSTVGRIRKPVAAAYAPGPGHGIQLKSGRILIAGNHYQKDGLATDGHKGLHDCSDYSNVIYSDDGGKTWNLGGVLPHSTDSLGRKLYTNEAQVAELDNGVVVMAMRTLNYQHPRAQSFSYDGGLTFQKAQIVPNLIEPGYKVSNGLLIPRVSPGCEGSILSFPAPLGATGNQTWALFSNPASEVTRKFMSLRLSYDGCRTWSNPYTIYPWFSGYSDLTYLGQGVKGQMFAIIHEGGIVGEVDKIMMRIFSLDALIKGIVSQQRTVF